jgi:hypothetical protein
MSNVAVNDAGDVMIFREGAWSRAPVAQNDQGARLFYDGTDWKDFPTASSAAPAAPAAPAASFGERVMQGLGDYPQGGAQFLTQTLPRGVVESVNNATAWVNRQPVIGPITQSLGMTPATPEAIQEQTVAREADYNRRRQASGAKPDDFDWGRFTGQAGASLAGGLAAGVPRSLLGAVGSGGMQGTVFGAAEPVTDPQRNYADAKKGQIETGGMFGAAAGGAGYALGRLISPRLSQEVRDLNARNVQMTPGQMLGGGYQRFEDKAASLPFVGDAITGARGRSIESFNRAAANEVLAPLGMTVPDNVPAGRALAEFVQDVTSRAQQQAIAKVQPFAPDQQFGQDLAQAAQKFMTPDKQQWFQGWLSDNVISRFQNGALDGESFKKIDSTLKSLVRNAQSSTNIADREVGDMAEGVQKALRDLMIRTNPQAAPEIQAADRAWALGVRFDLASTSQGAAGSPNAASGVFTPAGLSMAVRQADPSLRNRAYARGDAMLQDLSDAGRQVLPPSVPNSGSTDRLLLATMLSGGAAQSGIAPSVTLPAAALGAAAYGAYSPLGTRMLQAALLAQRPEMINAAGTALTAPGVSIPLASGLFASPPNPPRLN